MLHPPVFILGCPRSGTTLLAELLEFTSYGKPFETHFITKYYKKLSSYGDITKIENFRFLLNDISKERSIMQWKVDINAEEIFSKLNVIDYPHICDFICRLKSLQKGYAHWGDKTPHYTLDVSIIDKIFPKSKYIFIVRDGRDVALSLLQRPWGPNNFFSGAEYWNKYNVGSKILDNLQVNNQLICIKYEDLLLKADEIVPSLYRFLGEEYVPENCKTLIGNIKAENFNKWQSKMTSWQVKIFENISAKTLKHYGYEVRHEQAEINVLVRCFFKIHEVIRKVLFLFKLNIIDSFRIKFLEKEPFDE